MAQAIELFPADMRIELPWLLERLLRESIISEEDVTLCRASQGDQRDDKLHPIQVLARLNVDNLSNKGTSLSAKVLTTWLASKAQQPEFQIDPLKMNIPAITGVMSYAFAQRHQILATEVGPDYVEIGSTQPFLKAWEPDLKQTLKGKGIRRVVLNPEDYARYSVEFYNLARSVSGAHKHEQSGGSGAANFEQLLELGKLSSLRRMISMLSALWIGYCNMPSSSGPVTFILSHGETVVGCASALMVFFMMLTSFRQTLWWLSLVGSKFSAE